LFHDAPIIELEAAAESGGDGRGDLGLGDLHERTAP
jgi:hypothetical protein